MSAETGERKRQLQLVWTRALCGSSRVGVPSSVCGWLGEQGGGGQQGRSTSRARPVRQTSVAHHLLCDVGVLHHFCELFKVEFAVAVLVGLHHRCDPHNATDPHPRISVLHSGASAHRGGNERGDWDGRLTFVHDLLELLVLEVAADHHLEHQEQLAVGDEAVAVHVVHLERDCITHDMISTREGYCLASFCSAYTSTSHPSLPGC